MIDEREKLLKFIIRELSVLRYEIEARNSLNLQDINIIAENVFRDLLNLVYGYNLKNINPQNQNSPVFDLFDDDRDEKLVIQVTSDNSSSKVHDTINGFNEGTLYEKYDRLIILVLGNKLEFPRAKFANVGNRLFQKEHDILDFKGLLKEIDDGKLEKIETVAEFIRQHISSKMSIVQRKKGANEVETIMKLVEYLTQNSELSGAGETEPDPQKKMARFSDHQKYLETRIVNLGILYITPLSTSTEKLGLDAVRVKKIQFYLQKESNRYLNEHNNNPQKAIDAMVQFFSDKLTEADFDFDEQAAEFYLLDQLTKCNVFPNP